MKKIPPVYQSMEQCAYDYVRGLILKHILDYLTRYQKYIQHIQEREIDQYVIQGSVVKNFCDQSDYHVYLHKPELDKISVGMCDFGLVMPEPVFRQQNPELYKQYHDLYEQLSARNLEVIQIPNVPQNKNDDPAIQREQYRQDLLEYYVRLLLWNLKVAEAQANLM